MSFILKNHGSWHMEPEEQCLISHTDSGYRNTAHNPMLLTLKTSQLSTVMNAILGKRIMREKCPFFPFVSCFHLMRNVFTWACSGACVHAVGWGRWFEEGQAWGKVRCSPTYLLFPSISLLSVVLCSLPH